MTDVAVAQTDVANSAEAGQVIGGQIREELRGSPPDVLILFASSAHDYDVLLAAVAEACRPRALVGCSSAGEFTSEMRAEGSVCAFALRSPDMAFRGVVGRGLSRSREGAAAEMVAGLQSPTKGNFPYRSALVLADALAGYTDELLDHLTRLTAGTYQFFGGGAGDDGKFQQTHVFYGTEAVTDAAVALEILSAKPIGIGVRHGWQPASEAMRVTEAEGAQLRSMNAIPAVEVMEAHASSTTQTFDQAAPLPFFLHNVIGLDTGGNYKLRVPLAVSEDGAVLCASDVPTGATARLMQTTSPSAIAAAASAAQDAVRQLGGLRPKAALFFDCVATRLRLGQDFGFELESVKEAVQGVPLVGCNTYGQIVRVEGQFSGFHNCTAVVCVIPE